MSVVADYAFGSEAMEEPVSSRHDDEGPPLADRSWIDLGFVFGPALFTLSFFSVHSLVTGMSPGSYGLPEAFFLYGLVNVFAVTVLYRRSNPRANRAIFSFRSPSVRELTWTVIAFAGGLAAYPITVWAIGRLGLQPVEIPYSLSNPPILIMVVIGAVVTAPIAEETLFRGLLLGRLRSRDGGVVRAVCATTIAFAALYALAFGIVGLIFMSLWGLLPAVLRVRFDSLTGPVLLHVANNAVLAVILVGI